MDVTDGEPRALPRPPRDGEEEALTSTFQRALPRARPGEKWVERARIFDLGKQTGPRP